ncbi:hypothetical protein [Weissella cibaria]|uniref:hypothetical protein n=1 Tax=Weissella cibaria TaxID=137591 RepID=UPI001FD6A338|nr:hypothetical protein [Weissella cibaria]
MVNAISSSVKSWGTDYNGKRGYPAIRRQHFWQWSNFAIWSITIWLVLQGILTIPGTGSQYLYGYGVSAALFWIIGVSGGLKQRSKGN